MWNRRGGLFFAKNIQFCLEITSASESPNIFSQLFLIKQHLSHMEVDVDKMLLFFSKCGNLFWHQHFFLKKIRKTWVKGITALHSCGCLNLSAKTGAPALEMHTGECFQSFFWSTMLPDTKLVSPVVHSQRTKGLKRAERLHNQEPLFWCLDPAARTASVPTCLNQLEGGAGSAFICRNSSM